MHGASQRINTSRHGRHALRVAARVRAAAAPPVGGRWAGRGCGVSVPSLGRQVLSRCMDRVGCTIDASMSASGSPDLKSPAGDADAAACWAPSLAPGAYPPSLMMPGTPLSLFLVTCLFAVGGFCRTSPSPTSPPKMRLLAGAAVDFFGKTTTRSRNRPELAGAVEHTTPARDRCRSRSDLAPACATNKSRVLGFQLCIQSHLGTHAMGQCLSGDSGPGPAGRGPAHPVAKPCGLEHVRTCLEMESATGHGLLQFVVHGAAWRASADERTRWQVQEHGRQVVLSLFHGRGEHGARVAGLLNDQVFKVGATQNELQKVLRRGGMAMDHAVPGCVLRWPTLRPSPLIPCLGHSCTPSANSRRAASRTPCVIPWPLWRALPSAARPSRPR